MTAHLQYQIPWKRGAVGRLQLALRQRTGGWAGALLWNRPGQRLPAVDHAQRATGRHDDRCIRNPVYRRPGVQAGFTCNGVHATPTLPLPFALSGIAVRLYADPGPDAGNGERRPQSAAHRLAQSVRPGDGRSTTCSRGIATSGACN